MDQLPSNSHSARSSSEKEPREAVQRVVQGEVVVRKKPRLKRLTGAFFANRADVVAEMVTKDVLLPSFRNLLADSAYSFIDRMIFADGRGRASSRNFVQGVVTSIGSYGLQQPPQTNYAGIGRGAPQHQQPALSHTARARHDFREVVIPTRLEAEAVLDALFNRIAMYNAVTVADFLELCGVTAEWTDDKYGWSDIRGTGILRVGPGFVIDLPAPVVLD